MPGLFDDIPATSAGRGLFDDIPSAPTLSVDYARGARGASETQGLKPERGFLRRASDTIAPYAQGATANFADEIGAGAGVAGNWLARSLGMDIPEKTYRGILNEIQGNQAVFAEENPVSATAGEIIGSVAPGVGIASGMMRAIPALAQAPTWGRALLTGAATSAPLGAADEIGRMQGQNAPLDYGEAALAGGAKAAAGGGAFNALGHAAGAAVGPWATAAAQRLREAGVHLTPGETLGGMAKRVEDVAQSVPFIGQMVRNRQAASTESLNRVVWNEALAPAGQALPDNIPMGRQAAQEATRVLNQEYDRIVPQMGAVFDSRLDNEIDSIASNLPESVRNQFNDAINRHIYRNVNRSTFAIDGRGLQDAFQGLRREGRRLQTSRSSNAYDHDVGQALLDARGRLEEAAGRYTAPEVMADYNGVNQAYRNFTVLRRAASRTGTEQGVFDAQQLHASVRAADETAGKGATARGQAAMQQISDDARTVMTRRVSDSGTPERAAILALLAAGPAAAPLVGNAAAAGALPFALYTSPGNALFRSLAAGSPRTRAMLANAIRSTSRYAAPAAGNALAKQYLME